MSISTIFLALPALLLRRVPDKLRELAYFGFGLTLVSAMVAHAASGDGPLFVAQPLFVLGALIVSYRTQRLRARPRRSVLVSPSEDGAR